MGFSGSNEASPTPMKKLARLLRLTVILACPMMAACHSIFPGGDDANLAGLEPDSVKGVVSKQRLDSDGYPLLGAYPDAAAPQLSATAVTGARTSLKAEQQAHESGAAASSGEYQQSIAELEAVKARQKKAVDAAMKAGAAKSSAAAKAQSPDEVLREIEGK